MLAALRSALRIKPRFLEVRKCRSLAADEVIRALAVVALVITGVFS